MADPTDKDNYIRELNEDLRYSSSKFDGQTLAISGGALGVSLSFIKDIVPFQDSIYSSLFYLSQGLFILVIAGGFISHYLNIQGTRKAIKNADEEKYDQIVKDNLPTNRRIRGINIFVVSGLPLGLVLLVVYCMINIQHAKRADEKAFHNKKMFIEKNLDGSNLVIEGKVESFQFTDTTNSNATIKIQ